MRAKSNHSLTELSDKTMAGLDRLSSGAHQAADKVAQAAGTTARQLGRQGRALRVRQMRMTEGAREQVRRHPMTAVGMALGAGVLLGVGLLLRPFSRSSSTTDDSEE